MDELEDVEQCRFCGYIQLYKIKICSNCNKDLCYIIPENLNDLSFLECIKLIDDAFFRLESFMKGKLDYYNYFGFNGYISKLFYECKKEENFTVENCDLISPYWSLTNMLCMYIDKRDFKNENVFENDNFCNDWDELCIISNGRFREFSDFETTEYVETKTSITDIIASRQTDQPQQTEPFDLFDTSAVENEIKIIKEPNGEMFSNNGFELFEYILTELVKPKETKGRKSDLIYYYWEMHNNNPQYIHQRPAPFFNWFEKEYKETTGQLKTYYNVKTAQRIKDYSTALDWFKSIK